MASSVTRCMRSASGLAALALFVACGGATDPGLFSAGSTAGTSNHGGASSDGGAPARGGAAPGGASSAGSPSAAGEGSTEGGSANGGSSDGGAGNVGSSGAPQAGANSAGANAGGSGGSANGGSAGSLANAGSAGGESETCQSLFAKASKQLAAAQVCNLAMDSQSCAATVPNLCNCEVPVHSEDSAETKAYRATLDQLDKKKCIQVCTALACLPATHAVCKASAPGSAAGTCVASYATPL